MPGVPDVFFGFLVKGYLAPGSTEVIGFSLVFRLTSGSLGVNIHTTNRVFCHIFLLWLFGLDYSLSVRPKDRLKQGHLSHLHIGKFAYTRPGHKCAA